MLGIHQTSLFYYFVGSSDYQGVTLAFNLIYQPVGERMPVYYNVLNLVALVVLRFARGTLQWTNTTRTPAWRGPLLIGWQT